MQLVKIISSEIKSLKRTIKALRFGKNDVQNTIEAMPYGIDSAPIKDMVAVYSETSERGKAVIIGYINKNQIAEPGEFRTFSTDSSGDVQFYIYQKKDGTCHFGGDADNLVRYKKLKDAMDQLVLDLKAEFTLIQAGILAGGGSYNPTPTFDIDISAAKIIEIKTL